MVLHWSPGRTSAPLVHRLRVAPVRQHDAAPDGLGGVARPPPTETSAHEIAETRVMWCDISAKKVSTRDTEETP